MAHTVTDTASPHMQAGDAGRVAAEVQVQSLSAAGVPLAGGTAAFGVYSDHRLIGWGPPL